MCSVTEHFILKSNIDAAQEDAHNLELKGVTLGEVGEEDGKIWLRAETKVKKGSRGRKKGSRGKENYKLSSIRACTTPNTEGWCECIVMLLRYSRSVLCVFPETASQEDGTSHLQSWSVLKSVFFKENLDKLQALCPSFFSLQSHVHTYRIYPYITIPGLCLHAKCPR